jgi:hypothetical protein
MSLVFAKQVLDTPVEQAVASYVAKYATAGRRQTGWELG